MNKEYDPGSIEPRWQKKWEKARLYQARDFDKRRDKYYLLIEYPYPSGERLHVGHGRSYCAFDALARLKRMKGLNVLFPFGWDAFGLPAENYAVKTGVHPSKTTAKNIANARKQVKSWGLSFDWSREIDTTDPDYYRWTQWIFLQLFKEGLAYKAEVPVNWCPSCKTNLANEEVVQGACDRCGAATERRMQEQWMLKITAYADRLLEDLESVDYREDIKQQQVNWIGRSEGARIKFTVDSSQLTGRKKSKSVNRELNTINYIEVFTTRPDTLFGATFLVLSPEKVQDCLELMPSKERQAVERYIKGALKKSDLQRQEEIEDKTGVFTGIYAKHPATGGEVPIWVSDFVLPSYGTGAIMAVPAHDQRDFEFAKEFELPIKEVISSKDSSLPKEAFTGEGKLVNSCQFDGLQSEKAVAKITAWLKKKGLGEPAVDYKLRDWVFSRQHYWGEPIPLIFCERCAENVKSQISNLRSQKPEGLKEKTLRVSQGEWLNPGWVAVPEENLPVKLPHVEEFKPAETGESPLAKAKDWVSVKCPRCGGQARRETDTMPTWAGSSWYFLRYTDPKNSKLFADSRKLKYWMPVDWYNGGMEHTTLHLLYSRFWYKFLSDLNLVPGSEPYAKRASHGVILGLDNQKMSKSRGNVVNPNDVVAEFGADTFRVYEMFMGPFEQMIAWDPKGVLGVRRFLEKVWKAHSAVMSQEAGDRSNKGLKKGLHRLIKKVEEDLEKAKFNTAVASLMEFVNGVQAQINADTPHSAKASRGRRGLSVEDWGIFLKVLAPFAPHLVEELLHQLDPKPYTLDPSFSIHAQAWPKYDPKLIKEDVVTIVVQVNGKLRGRLEVKSGVEEGEVAKMAKGLETVKPHLSGVKLVKTIFIPDNLINFVTS